MEMEADIPAEPIVSLTRHLPHRFPHPLIDRIEELVPGKRIVAVCEIRPDAPWFVGHFPGDPVMPGVLQVEALAQASLLLIKASRTEGEAGKTPWEFRLQGLDNVRFRQRVPPGKAMVLEASIRRVRGDTWTIHGVTVVEGERAAEATIIASAYQPSEGT